MYRPRSFWAADRNLSKELKILGTIHRMIFGQTAAKYFATSHPAPWASLISFSDEASYKIGFLLAGLHLFMVYFYLLDCYSGSGPRFIYCGVYFIYWFSSIIVGRYFWRVWIKLHKRSFNTVFLHGVLGTAWYFLYLFLLVVLGEESLIIKDFRKTQVYTATSSKWQCQLLRTDIRNSFLLLIGQVNMSNFHHPFERPMLGHPHPTPSSLNPEVHNRDISPRTSHEKRVRTWLLMVFYVHS